MKNIKNFITDKVFNKHIFSKLHFKLCSTLYFWISGIIIKISSV